MLQLFIREKLLYASIHPWKRLKIVISPLAPSRFKRRMNFVMLDHSNFQAQHEQMRAVT